MPAAQADAAGTAADPVRTGRGKAPETVTAEQVEAIRLLWAEQSLRQHEIGRRFGIGQQQVSRIVRGQSRADQPVFSAWQMRGFSGPQAYSLCSVAVDLKVSQVVDVPNVLISAFLPLDIFE